MKFAPTAFNILHYASGMLLHYVGKLIVQFAADLVENATKMHRLLHALLYCISLTYLLINGVLF